MRDRDRETDQPPDLETGPRGRDLDLSSWLIIIPGHVGATFGETQNQW